MYISHPLANHYDCVLTLTCASDHFVDWLVEEEELSSLHLFRTAGTHHRTQTKEEVLPSQGHMQDSTVHEGSTQVAASMAS